MGMAHRGFSTPGINTLRLSWPQDLLPIHPLNAQHLYYLHTASPFWAHSTTLPLAQTDRYPDDNFGSYLSAGNKDSETPNRSLYHSISLFPKPGVLCGL